MNLERTERHSNRGFAWLLGFLLLLIFCRYALQINIPRILFLVILALMAVRGTQTQLIAICICMIPLHESVDFYYSLVICAVIYVMKFYRRIRINLATLLVLTLIVWELLHCFSPDMSLVNMIIPVVPLLVLALFMSSDLSELDYGFVVRSFAFATVAICITMFGQVLYWCGFSFVKAVLQLRRLGVVLETSGKSSGITGGTIQTNSLGIICVLAATGLLQLRSAQDKRKADPMLMLTLLTFGALTSSRTFLVCLALMVFLMILGQNGGFRKKFRFLCSIAAMVILVVLLMNLFFPQLLEYYISRFSDKDITTGRDVLMMKYHQFITRNPRVMFFGIGLQDYGEKLTEGYRIASNVPHNSLQEVVIAWGLPGLILCGALVVTVVFVSGKQKNRHMLLNYVPLVILLFKSMAGQMLTSGYSMLAVSYAYLSLCQDFRPEGQKSYVILQSSGYDNLKRPG